MPGTGGAPGVIVEVQAAILIFTSGWYTRHARRLARLDRLVLQAFTTPTHFAMDDPKPATARIAVLAALLFQSVAYNLLRRYSQGVLHENYSYAEVLVLAEVAKTAVAGAVITACSTSTSSRGTLCLNRVQNSDEFWSPTKIWSGLP